MDVVLLCRWGFGPSICFVSTSIMAKSRSAKRVGGEAASSPSHASENHFGEPIRLGRRTFLINGSLVLLAAKTGCRRASPRAEKENANRENDLPLKIGLVTDLHYADKASAGSRHYRETLTKLEMAAQQFQKDGVHLVAELGDFIDAASSVDVEQSYLKAINAEFSKISPDRHYVLGNHCVDTLKKKEFLEGVEQATSYYSFDRRGVHFVVLDSCFRSDGEPYGRNNAKWTDANIPPEELKWLRDDLRENQTPTIVFAHQRLDVNNNYGVKNNSEVRQILESSGNVLAVFQGHSHKNDLKQIGGIHYCTLVAMVEGSGTENNGYSVMSIDSDSTIRLTGFAKQASRRLAPAPQVVG